jgi:hypothetical protein
MSTAICTLFEGHYHLGAAALINSLQASGFRGRFICGLRGPLPPWAEPSRIGPGNTHIKDLDGIEIWFVPLATRLHFTNYKPEFLLEMWEGPAGNPDNFYYVDPDIVVKCPWAPLERWGCGGLAVCEDVNPNLPPRHPLRLGWSDWCTKQGLAIVSQKNEKYFSAGFVGVPREHKTVLQIWADLIRRIGETNGTLANIKEGGPTALFHTPDQDALNIALMLTDTPLNTAGPEAMDFAVGGHYLSHAIGTPKPWQGGFIRNALRGLPPSMAAKEFFNYTHQPISVFPPAKRTRLTLALKIAAFIGRFYRRT